MAEISEIDEAKSLLKRALAFVELCIEEGELHSETSGEPCDLAEEIEAFLAPKPEPKLEYDICYGCGASNPAERCLGCSHPFGYRSVHESHNRPSGRYA